MATVNKTGYTGAIRVQGIQIEKREIKADNLEVTLNKDSVSFAERSSISSEIVTVKDKETGDVFPASTYSVTANTALNNVGDSAQLKITFNNLAKDEMIGRNYTTGTTSNTKLTDGKVKLTANNISDFKIVTDSVKREGFNAGKAKAAIHFYLGDKEVTSYVNNNITFAPEAVQEGATSVNVALNGDNKNILGNTTVSINLTLNEITKDNLTLKIDGTTWSTSSATIANKTYTGEEITREVKDVKVGTTGLTTSDYKIEYVGDRTNAFAVSNKKVEMYIVGVGDWSGRIKLGEFQIDQAEIKTDDIKVPETVQYDGSIQTAADYMDGKVSVQANTTVNGESKKIDVPADAYTLTYSISPNSLAVGTQITTKLESAKITNKNFKTENNTTLTASKTTMISNKSLSDENVKVEVVGGPYTYTGKAVVPTLKVTVDGVELALDRDYEIKTSSNSIDAGTASVTVVGINDYSGSQTVNYVINKANLSDVKAEAKVSTDAEKLNFTYTGKQVKPTSDKFKITLNGVELNSSDFAITYPTSSFTNVDAGEATVTLVPVKGNENFNGDKLEVKFNILPAKLTTNYLNGTFYAFDENGNKIDFNSNYTFAYDGTEKTFKDVTFVPSKAEYNGTKLVEGKDYEIKYFNNVTGPTASVYVTGIGNYTGSTAFTGSETTYTVKQDFKIEGVTIDQRNVVLKDTEYAGGVATTPNLTITVGSKTLVEGTDYEFINLKDNVDVTPDNKVLKATLKLKGGYKLNAANGAWTGAFSNANATTNTVDVTWKIVKKDFANTTMTATKEGENIKVTVMNGNVIVPEKEYDVKDNGDGTVTVSAKSTSTCYVGSQTITMDAQDTVIETPIISEVKVNGNKIEVVLAGESDGATGYDYVISTSNDYQNGRLPNGINKNQLTTNTTYQYIDQGIYYAYCHAWKRVNGVKVFSEWSNIMPFSVSAITPEKPTITSVKKTGRNVTVTWTQCDDAQGYDVVLGTAVRKVNGELRPVEYGKAVKKVGKNTYSVTFKSCPKGATFYAGLHAWNRTSETGVKVFSPWSDSVKVTI